jgi:chromosome segregation ATPase
MAEDRDRLYLLSEAAELTGATVEAIRQRIRRGTLHAIKGNDGRVRTRLTEADIAALKAARPSGQPSERPSGRHDEDSSAIKALESHIETLREELMRERQRAGTTDAHARDLAVRLEALTDKLDQAHRDRQAESERRARLEMDMAGLSSELEQERARIADLKAEGELQVERLTAELNEARRPWWKRWRR